jgi:S1-C subfamily serine protease
MNSCKNKVLAFWNNSSCRAKALKGFGIFLIALAIILSLSGKKNDITQSSVMITNIAGTSGGTGIVLHSSETSSTILTNSHVCRVVEKGGMVTGESGSFIVATYKHSHTHDLCLITVDGNLKAHTDIAHRAPYIYKEGAAISGHPALFPNVITTGHFSGRRVISVMKGMTPCTDDQKKDPDTMLLCLLAGGLPQIEQYDSTLVTATIMPGSSGSGVYNEDKELSGVAFAGSGDLGYAWTVPFESMRNFLDREARTLEAKRPDNSLDILAALSGKKNSLDENAMMQKLKEACAGEQKNKLKSVCELAGQDMIFRK